MRGLWEERFARGMRKKIKNGLGFVIAQVEELRGRVYVYDRLNRRVGWVAKNGTFDFLNRKITSAKEIGILIERARMRGRRG